MNNNGTKGKWFRFRFQLENVEQPEALKLQKCTIMAYYRGRLDAHNAHKLVKHEIEFKWVQLKSPKYNYALEAYLTPPPTAVFNSIDEMAYSSSVNSRGEDSTLGTSRLMAASANLAGFQEAGDGGTIDPPRPPQPPPPDMASFTNAL